MIWDALQDSKTENELNINIYEQKNIQHYHKTQPDIDILKIFERRGLKGNDQIFR